MYIVYMSDIQFEWDSSKNRTNISKHGVSFEDAESVFVDENAIRYFDPDHSDEEDRFLLLGIAATLRVLVVCHCYRAEESIIRIVSARKADKTESQTYWDSRR